MKNEVSKKFKNRVLGIAMMGMTFLVSSNTTYADVIDGNSQASKEIVSHSASMNILPVVAVIAIAIVIVAVIVVKRKKK